MKRVLAAVLGIAGYLVLAWAYPKAMGTHRNFPFTREQVHAKTTAAVKVAFDSDISKTEWATNPEVRTTLLLWQERFAKQPEDYLASGTELLVVYSGTTSRTTTIGFTPRGTISSLKQLGGRGRKGQKPIAPEVRDERVRKTFELLAGEYAAKFTAQEGVGSNQYRWTMPTSDARVHWRLNIIADANGVREAEITAQIAEEARKEFLQAIFGLGDPRKVLGGVTVAVGIPILVGMLIFAWMRRQVDKKAAFTAGVIFVVPSALLSPFAFGWGGVFSITSFGTSLVVGLLMMAMIAVGQRAARDQEWTQWLDLRLLLQRHWKAKGIGRSIASGLLWSGWLAAIPCLIVISGLFPNAALSNTHSLITQFLRTPALMQFNYPFEMFSLTIFALLLPLVSQRIPTRLLSLLFFLPVAVLGVYLVIPFVAGWQAALAATASIVVTMLAIYLRFGLLSLLMAGTGVFAAWSAAGLHNSGAPALDRSAWSIAFGLAAIWIGGLVLARIGVEQEPDDPIAAQFLSRKEKLQAAFSMAQQAQQRMLPQQPPSIPGFQVAAMCQPARDVGGDLFEYYSFADGRAGFCVADVSGKGMPAALYMTLTKGLIAAASPDSSGVADLSSRVNRHLHIACKRKMFVTGIFASLDPESRTVEMVRAGHNPALLYEASSRKARYLNPAGIGLGLAGPSIFDRGAKASSFPLNSGDALILYSDGVTEAMNERLDLYGEERLKETLERCAHGNADHILSEIKSDLARFTGAEPAHDDVTLMILQAQQLV